MTVEIVDLGASELDEATGVIIAQAKGAPVDEEDAPGYCSSPMVSCLGVAARPAPADEDGSAQGVASQTGGYDGVIIGGHDPRAAKVYGEIQPGETAFFATGKNYDSRALAKNQLFAVIVGDDYVVSVDRKNKKVAISTPGGTIQLSEQDGITLADKSGGSFQISDKTAVLSAQCIIGGRSPAGKLTDDTFLQVELKKIQATLASGANSGGSVVFSVPYIPGKTASPVSHGK